MNELVLFAGAGGSVWGGKLLGWRTVGYVEYDDYRQRVLHRRIDDGIFDAAPIFGDITTFLSDGFAASYSGMVDVITAGFPCQPFSRAGKLLGSLDERNRWPETADTIRIVRPRYVLLENTPGIESYLPVVIGDLRRADYCVHPPAYIAAAALGAGHLRKRIWIYAHLSSERKRRISIQPRRQNEAGADITGDCAVRSNAIETGFSDAERREAVNECARIASARAHDWRTERIPCWETEPDLVRVVHGMADGRDRIAALGDGQVPAVAAAAWRILSGR